MRKKHSRKTIKSTHEGIDHFIPLILICIFYGITPLFCQIEIEETLFEDQTEEAASELLEYLQSLQLHPLDLNRATLQNLQSLPFLSPLQTRKIITERSNNGSFQSWNDFQLRMDFEEDLCNHLQLYLIIIEEEEAKHEFMELRWRLQTQSPKSSGYNSGKYSGSPVKAYERLHFSFNKNTHGSLLIEKDPGESQWHDHFVGFIEMDQLSFLSKIVIGSYRIEVGQGLVLWGPYGYSKGGDPTASVKKRSTGIRGYTYSDENRYLNGIAFEITYQSFSFMGFISSNCLDATLNDDGTISSLSSSGYHRTESEINHKDRLKETLSGLRIMKSGSWGTVGFTGYQNHYSNAIKKSDPTRYRFYFQGDRNHIIGLDYDIFISQFNLSGEMARSRSQGWALISNCMAKLGKSSLIISYRRFEPDFQNLHSNGFGVSPACNEEGFYFGYSGRITSSLRLSIYYDLFKKPWRTYYTPVPTRGDDLFIQVEKKWSSKLNTTFRARVRQGELIETGETSSGIEIDYLQDRIHRLFRFELQYQPSDRLRLRNRLETVYVDYPDMGNSITRSFSKESGLLLYHDLLCRPAQDLSIYVRWITFDTDSYDSRIYAYENDLPGVLTSHLFYLKGTRGYLVVRWGVWKNLTISAKFSTTIHRDVDHWGSGYDEIQGGVEKQLAVQADLKL